MLSSFTGARLTVVGDASIDYFVRVPHLAGSDNKAIGRLVGIHGGGMSANLAAAAARSGADVSLITSMGDDQDAAEAATELHNLGVNLDRSIIKPGARTWLCFVQLDATGEKALVGADTGIKVPEPSEIQFDPPSGAEIVAPLADDLPWAAEIAVSARKSGRLVAIDLEPDATRPGDPAFERLIAATDVLFMNRAAASVVAASPEAAAAAMFEREVELVVVSAGAEGAYCFGRDGNAIHGSPVDHVEVVDTTGAGDALAGSMLGALTTGADLATALRVGLESATRCIQHIGARTYLSEPNAGPVRIHLDRLT